MTVFQRHPPRAHGGLAEAGPRQEFLEGSRQSAGNVKISVQADVKEVQVAGDLG